MGDHKKVGRPSKYPSRLTVFVSQDTHEMVMCLKVLYKENSPAFLRRVILAGVYSLSHDAEQELETLKASLNKWEKILEKEREER